MPRRSLIVTALALSVTLGGSAVAFAQTDNRITTGVNAGDYSSSSAGSDGNVVVANPERRLPGGITRPAGNGATTQADPTPAPSGPVPPVIPPNPALTGEAFPGSLEPTITEETTSDDSVLGPAPTPVAESATTADASADRESRRSSGDAEASATDGPSTGGTVNDFPASTTGSPSTRSTTGSSASGACGYPTWLDAQNALETEWSVNLADALDPDRDGIACEEAMI